MHYIFTIIVIGVIIFFQRKYFVETKDKINLFKSIFPKLNKFKLLTIYLPKDEVELFSEEIYKKHPNIFQKVPKVFAIKVNDLVQYYSLADYASVIASNYNTYYELKYQKANRKPRFVDVTKIEELVEDGWVLAEEPIDYIEVTIIEIPTNANQVLQKIITSINTYLLRNKGAVSDFNLVKDIVERNCDAEDEEINTLLPIPLYLGLMGTMLGIIIGVSYMAFEGFSDISTATIEALMGSVGIAMVASFFGLAFTTYGSGVFYKKAKSQVESQKNDFYTFIQTELLPSISNNATNSIVTLQSNLLKFNEGFTRNVDKFDGLLQDILDSFRNQISIVEDLKNVDVAKLARLNIDVLKELRTSTKEFEKFNQYLEKVNEVVENATHLNSTLMDDIEKREAAANYMFTKISLAFEDGVNLLRNSTDERIKKIETNTLQQQNAYEQYLYDSNKILIQLVDEKNATVAAHIKQNNEILSELQKHTETRDAIVKMTGTLKDQNNTLAEFRKVVESLNRKVSGTIGAEGGGNNEHPYFRYIKYTCIGSGAIIGVGYIGYNLVIWSTALFKLIF